jgi:hypothetical protein
MDFHCRLEPVAAAGGGDAEVERGVAGVAALIDQVLGRFLLRADLDELLVGLMVFAEMGAKPALTLVNLQHGRLLFSAAEDVAAPRNKPAISRSTSMYITRVRSQIRCHCGRRLGINCSIPGFPKAAPSRAELLVHSEGR